MTYRHITTKNYMTYDIKFSHIVAALVEINQQHALRKLTLATHMHLTTCTGSHLALQLGWKKTKKKLCLIALSLMSQC